MKLSERSIKSLKWSGKDKILNDGGGLYLNLRRSSKTFIVRKRRQGRMLVTTLGKWKKNKDSPGMTLSEARAKTAIMVLEGSASEMTVRLLVDKYQSEVIEVNHKRPFLADGYWRRAVIPNLGSKRVTDVRPYDISQMVEAYAKEKGKRTGDQLRSITKMLFGYAVELGVVLANPAAHVTARVTGYKYQPRERVLTDDEIKKLWAETKHNARLLRFLLLTGLRISEAQKGHQDGDRWIVPAEISKNGKAHWVHLSIEAKAQLPFPASTPTNIQAWLRRWCINHKINPRFSPHDLRRTAATRMAGNGVEPFIIERVLNHTLQGVMGIYNKAEYEDERIVAAKALEKHVVSVINARNQDRSS